MTPPRSRPTPHPGISHPDREVLADIQSGAFANRFIDDQDAGAPEFKELRETEAKHQIEVVGKDLRKMFSWSAQAIDSDYVEGSAAR